MSLPTDEQFKEYTRKLFAMPKVIAPRSERDQGRRPARWAVALFVFWACAAAVVILIVLGTAPE